MPRKKKEIKVGALVSAFRRKEPGLGLVIAIYTREQLKEKKILMHTYQYHDVPGESAAKIKWVKHPTHLETHQNDMSMLPVTWLRVIGEAK